MLKFIAPLLAVLVLIVLPLWMIARRAKAGKERQKAALCQYLRLLPRHVRNGGGVPWAGASLRRTTRPRSPRLPAAGLDQRPSVTWRRRWPVGISGIASGIAVSNSACAAIGALTETRAASASP